MWLRLREGYNRSETTVLLLIFQRRKIYAATANARLHGMLNNANINKDRRSKPYWLCHPPWCGAPVCQYVSSLVLCDGILRANHLECMCRQKGGTLFPRLRV